MKSQINRFNGILVLVSHRLRVAYNEFIRGSIEDYYQKFYEGHKRLKSLNNLTALTMIALLIAAVVIAKFGSIAVARIFFLITAAGVLAWHIPSHRKMEDEIIIAGSALVQFEWAIKSLRTRFNEENTALYGHLVHANLIFMARDVIAAQRLYSLAVEGKCTVEAMNELVANQAYLSPTETLLLNVVAASRPDSVILCAAGINKETAEDRLKLALDNEKLFGLSHERRSIFQEVERLDNVKD